VAKKLLLKPLASFSRHSGFDFAAFVTGFQIKLRLQQWARLGRAARSLNLNLIRRGSRRVE
jgi:hypothetical protein